MHATHDRDQFAPPRPPGRLRAVALAVLAHAALIGALTWGVNWKSSTDQPAVEAELWSALPQQAAPRAVEPPPPPPPSPTPEPAPAPTPAPPPPPPPRQEQADAREADIALEREKKRLQEEKKKREQLEREKRERERQAQLEREKKEKERLQKEKEKAEREKAEREKEQREKQLAEQKKLEQQKAEQEKQKKLAEDKRKAAEEAKRVEAMRQDNLRRMMQGVPGATGGESATGTALRSAGPSGGYGGKVAAKVKPNIVYPDTISGNPRAEVEVRAAPDGTIVGTRIIQSSGNKAWDDAVVRALQRTETLPRDVDGRVPSSLVIGFRPKD